MQITNIQTDHTLMAVDLRSALEYPIGFFLDVMDAFEQSRIQWHWHPELEFNVITRGTMEYYVENEHYTLTAGQGILKNVNILHMAEPAKSTPDAEMFSVIMDPEFIAPSRSMIFRKYIAPFTTAPELRCLLLYDQVPWQQEILSNLRRAYDLSQTQEWAHELTIHQLMCAIWSTLLRHQAEIPRHTLSPKERINQLRIKQMITFIQTHFHEKITLSQIADAANISVNTCLTCFRQITELSPMEYLLNCRMEHAIYLLLTTDDTLASISEACGFGDSSYFGKLFRKRIGMSPSQYRQRRNSSHPSDAGAKD